MDDRILMKPLQTNQRIAAIRRFPHIRYAATPYMLAKQPRMKRTGWLARLCWKVLHRIGALEPYSERIEIYTFDSCIQERITDRVMFAAEAILERGERPENYAVVMGEVELREVWKEMELNQSFVTMQTKEYRYQDSYRGRTVMGLNVHAVAGLIGVALIPKVLIEKNVDVAKEYRFHLRQITHTTTVSECQKIARGALGE